MLYSEVALRFLTVFSAFSRTCWEEKKNDEEENKNCQSKRNNLCCHWVNEKYVHWAFIMTLCFSRIDTGFKHKCEQFDGN